jgi:hypothetical protein
LFDCSYHVAVADASHFGALCVRTRTDRNSYSVLDISDDIVRYVKHRTDEMSFCISSFAWYGCRVSKNGADRKKQDEATRLAELVERIAANAMELRLIRGWTQLKAAEQCSMASRLYRRVEKGESPASLPTIARLCNGFDVDVMRLVRPFKR